MFGCMREAAFGVLVIGDVGDAGFERGRRSARQDAQPARLVIVAEPIGEVAFARNAQFGPDPAVVQQAEAQIRWHRPS